jgi:hypothetical protein
MDYTTSGTMDLRESPKVWLKKESTCFFIDNKIAVPTDDDVPCSVGILGFLLWERTPGGWASMQPKNVLSLFSGMAGYGAVGQS